MSHEISTTDNDTENRKWVNRSGLTGKVLDPRYDFERTEYDTRDDADNRADLRSKTFDREVKARTPPGRRFTSPRERGRSF